MTHYRTVTARIEGLTREAVRLRDGTLAAWIPRTLLDGPSRRALALAAVGDSVEVAVQRWKLTELRWPEPRDTATPGLFPETGDSR